MKVRPVSETQKTAGGKNMKKKIVCVLLSFALVLALIPTAFAVADVYYDYRDGKGRR